MKTSLISIITCFKTLICFMHWITLNISLLVNLSATYSVTRNYFENLVRALENGLSDVNSHGASSGTTSSKSTAGSSKGGRSGRGKGVSRTASSTRSGDNATHWSCEHCTFVNTRSATTCEMCHQRHWKPLMVSIKRKIGEREQVINNKGEMEMSDLMG